MLLPTPPALLGLVIYGLGSEFVAGAYRELNLDGADIGPSRTAILTVGGIFLLVGFLYVVVVAGLLLVVGLLVQRLWSGRRVARPRTQEAGFRVVLAALFLTNSGSPEPFSDSKIRMIGRIGASLIATGVGVFLLGVFPESIYNAGASYTRAAVSCRNAGFWVNSLASASDVSLPWCKCYPRARPSPRSSRCVLGASCPAHDGRGPGVRPRARGDLLGAGRTGRPRPDLATYRPIAGPAVAPWFRNGGSYENRPLAVDRPGCRFGVMTGVVGRQCKLSWLWDGRWVIPARLQSAVTRGASNRAANRFDTEHPSRAPAV